jgi:transglutaminase-like putative cysteine protease
MYKKYLESSEYIDWNNPCVYKKALELSKNCDSEEIIVKACFEFVRDGIKHSWDYKLNPVTCRASDVLKEGTGYCYAKSHLLAALLRANGIPTGLCYQRLTVTDSPPYCLHGLNAVYLKKYGWYRVDARGNKSGVSAEFSPPLERLAFPIKDSGERDLPEIWAEPCYLVVKVLNESRTIEEVYANLPDIELLSS